MKAITKIYSKFAPLLVVVAMAAALLPFGTASATNFNKSCSDIGSGSNRDTNIIACNTQGGNPAMSIILQVTNFLAIGVGIAVVGGIVWGALMYISSNGDAAKTKQAITIIVNAVIGLLLFIFGWALVNALVPGGLL